MIYLTFDSNIWIYSLDESWQIENQLDYLEPWVQKGEVKLLLPKMIIDEWSKHEKKQVEERAKKLREFFEMAEEILPSAFFAEYKEPAIQRKIIDDQLNRAKNLILQSEIIPEYSEVKDRIIFDGIAKKAPLHRKSSVADAIIVYSLIHFSRLNPGNHYFFISTNTEDFYEKGKDGKEIHQDLKPDFEANNIKAFNTLNRLIHFLKTDHNLKVGENINQIRKERIRNKIKEKIYNPDYDKLTGDSEMLYIQNVNTIEFILKETRPTKEQVIFVLALTDSDIAYERDFYKRLDKPGWFEILKRKGVFNPLNNPAPVKVKEGFQFPFWEPLIYLENLSLQIKNGQNLELIDEIISIISNTSKSPNDNYRTWYWFIKILGNLPNEKISLDILNFIPTWFKGIFDTMMQSSEICKKLLPKFLSENPTVDDIKKAELILKHLFSLEKTEAPKEVPFGLDGTSYHSRVYLRFLSDVLIEKKFTSKIVAHCSDKTIIDLAEKIKILRLDFPSGINLYLTIKDKSYNVKAEIDGKNLCFEFSEKEHKEKIIGRNKIEKFENLTDEQMRVSVISTLKELGLEYEESKNNEYEIELLTKTLRNGSHHSFLDDPISELDDYHYHGNNVVKVFSLFFRNLLNDKIKQNKEAGIELLKLFTFDNKYRLSFFLRVVLFVIGDNWKACKNLFWEIVKDNDPMLIFSNHSFHKDLYELLKKNQLNFREEDKKSLQKIINKGSQDKKRPMDKDYWSVRWYAALRDIDPFKSRYDELSISQNLTHNNFESQSLIRWGSVSPLSVNEVLNQSNEEIANFINEFKPKTAWEDPSVDGFSNVFKTAVENNPLKFSSEIELYKELYYLYAYQLAEGFIEAWKNKKSFNWEKVLIFYKEYISSEKLTSGQLHLENDGWGATADWVLGSVGNLLTEGMQSDSNAFDLSLLPTVKDILKTLVSSLKPVEDFNQTNMGYLNYSLNSTAGKIIRALLEYSLMRARNLNTEGNSPKWEKEIKDLLDETFQNGIIDGYILTGCYFQQLFFLDKDWITDKVRQYYKLEDKEWLAFLGGFSFSNPPSNKEIYYLLHPHYERAIKNHDQIKDSLGEGIITHILTFYFLGFEDLKSNGLLTSLINKGNHTNILELVNSIWRQEVYLKSLYPVEAKNFVELIFNLWSCLANKYVKATGTEEQKILVGLSNFLVFVPELNDAFTQLVLMSIGIVGEHFHYYYLVENLVKLKDRGTPSESAKYIGVILNSIQITPNFSPTVDGRIINLVIFLYENGQKLIADDFCNKMARQGDESFIEIHNKYKE